jgi:hypothetical protein
MALVVKGSSIVIPEITKHRKNKGGLLTENK